MKETVKKLIVIISLVLSSVNFSFCLPVGPLNLEISIVRSALVFFFILFIIKELTFINSTNKQIVFEA